MAIAHKSDRGYVDLTLYGKGSDFQIIESKFSNLFDSKMALVKTSKSTSIRIMVPKVDFEREFETQIDEVNIALKAVSDLFELSKKIN